MRTPKRIYIDKKSNSCTNTQPSEVHEVGTRTGTLYGLLGLITLTSTLSAGAIVDDMDGNFLGLKIFCGASIVAGVLFLVWARVSVGGWKIRAIA